MASAIPILMNALAKNSSTPEGAEALQNAIDRDHDGTITGDIAQMGMSILGRLFFFRNDQDLSGINLIRTFQHRLVSLKYQRVFIGITVITLCNF
jgi:Bacterial protein of unknown function (DUF937)